MKIYMFLVMLLVASVASATIVKDTVIEIPARTVCRTVCVPIPFTSLKLCALVCEDFGPVSMGQAGNH